MGIFLSILAGAGGASLFLVVCEVLAGFLYELVFERRN